MSPSMAYKSNRREQYVQMPAKIARSAARPPFGLPEMLVAVHASRLSCREAEKAPIFTPVQESSGESKIEGAALKIGGRAGTKKRKNVAPL
jgi:hypothetical protein